MKLKFDTTYPAAHSNARTYQRCSALVHQVRAGVTRSLADVEVALEPARMGGQCDLGVESVSFAYETVQVYRQLIKLQPERNAD